jgi:predicted Zn-dependent protease
LGPERDTPPRRRRADPAAARARPAQAPRRGAEEEPGGAAGVAGVAADWALDETLRGLVRHGLADAEAMVKRGRSRRLVRDLGGEISVASQERAWAVRASTRRASFFAAGTGDLPDGAGWPEASARPFRLAEPTAAPPWSEPSDFAAPLIGESEGLRLLASLESELAAELPGARLLHAALEDGSSEGQLANSRGLRVRFRRRLATLRLEAAGPGRPAAAAELYLAAREARHFNPKALARRLADRLSLQASGLRAGNGGGAQGPEMSAIGGALGLAGVPGVPGAGGAGGAAGGVTILSPAVAASLLAGLLPLLVGPGAAALAAPLRDRRGRIGSERLTIADNGRLPGGALECPVDGEGVPCREVLLVEGGVFRQPLLAWWQADGAVPGQPSGCSRRPGWRDLLSPGPTHLYVQPDPRVSVAALLGDAGRGAYLVEPTGRARYDTATDQFALPVCGFSVAAGQAGAPIPAAWLCGTAAAFFRGIAAVGRDLAFLPLDGMIGSPTLLVTGLSLRAAP